MSGATRLENLTPEERRRLALRLRMRRAAENATRLVERLRARLGEDAVRGLTLVPDHRPERAWRFAAPGAPARDAATPARRATSWAVTRSMKSFVDGKMWQEHTRSWRRQGCGNRAGAVSAGSLMRGIHPSNGNFWQ